MYARGLMRCRPCWDIGVGLRENNWLCMRGIVLRYTELLNFTSVFKRDVCIAVELYSERTKACL